MIESLTALVFTFMVNYFIHSSLFILLVLAAIYCRAVRLDGTGEWLMKTALVLGLFTAMIQTGGWLSQLNQSHASNLPWIYQLPADSQTTQASPVPIVDKLPNTQQQGIGIAPEQLLANAHVVDVNAAAQTSTIPEPGIKPVEQRAWPHIISMVVLLWLTVTTLLLFRYIHQKQQLKRLLMHRQEVPDKAVQKQFKQLLETAGITRQIRLTQCAETATPIAIHNEVVLPDNYIIDQQADHIAAALAHELAHIKRKDVLWLRSNQILQAGLFFQPLNQLLIQQINPRAEQRADTLAASWTQNHRALAATLAANIIKENAYKPSFNPTQMVPAMTSKKSNVLQRIENLLNRDPLRTRKYWPVLLASLTLLVLMMSPGVIAEIVWSDKNEHTDGQSRKHSSRHIEIDGGMTDMSVSYSGDDKNFSLKAKLKGELKFNDEETDITVFPPNSSFDLKVDADGVTKRLLIKSDRGAQDGSANYTYYENGDQLAYDQAARNWFATVIPEVLRNTGLGAKDRVARIQRLHGDRAVLNEIELIQSDWVRKSYFNYLFNISELNQADLLRAMQLSTDISSDFELSHVLNKMVQTQAVDSESEWLQMLQSTSSIQSDFEMAKTLLVFQDHLPMSESINQAYFTSAASIQSDFEMSKVLISYVDRQQANSVNLMHLFELATEIESDFELAKLLLALNSQMSQANDDVFSSYLDLATSIQSDFEMKKVYSNLLNYDLSTANLSQMIESAAADINSDFELSALLVEVLQHDQANDRVHEMVKNATKNSISSSFEREKVLSYLL